MTVPARWLEYGNNFVPCQDPAIDPCFDPCGRTATACFSLVSLFGASDLGALYLPWVLASLAQDSAGTTAVTSDNDPIGRILDITGNGNDLTQATGTNRPLYRLGSGLHSMQFDGTNDSLEGAYTQTAYPLTIMVAAEYETVQEGGVAVVSQSDTIYKQVQYESNVTQNRWGAEDRNAGTISAIDTAASATGAVVLRAEFTSSQTLLQIDNETAVTSVNTNAFGTPTEILLGRQATDFYAGRIFGALIIDRILTSAERDLATGALATFAGITSLTSLLGGRAVCGFPPASVITGDFSPFDFNDNDFNT